jgi:ribosomal-protein-alanine N-acetyltransferase
MNILPATLRDLGSLRRLEHACFLEDSWPLLDLIAVLTYPDVIRLKAVNGDKMIGFIASDPRPSEGLAWIATVGVAPEYRRQGIARALLHESESRIKQSRIRLCVRPSNQAAIRLYQVEGYLEVDTWRKYYNDGENALVMEKIRGTQNVIT